MSDQENTTDPPEQSPSAPEPALPELEPYSPEIFIEETHSLDPPGEKR